MDITQLEISTTPTTITSLDLKKGGLFYIIPVDNPLLPSEAIGSYIDKDYTTASDLTDHTVSTTTSTIGLISSKLNMTGGNGSFDNFIQVDAQDGRSTVTCLYKWEQVVQFTAVDKVAGGGVGVGIEKYTGGDRGVIGVLHLTTGANNGKISLYYNGGTLISTSSAALTWVAGDEIKITSSRVDNVWTVTAENLTTPDTVSNTYTFLFTQASSIFNHRQGYFSIYNIGGQQDVTVNTVTSNQLKNVEYLVIGDSIAYGTYAGSEQNRFWKQLSTLKEVEPLAGGGTQTSEIVAQLDEINLIRPKNAIIMIGGNDIFFSVPDATWKANLDTIRLSLKANGTNIIWCHNTPRDATDITAINSYITTNYTTDTIISKTFDDFSDGSTGMGAAFNSGDDVHPGGWGNFMLNRTIGSELGFTIQDLVKTAFTNATNVTLAANNMVKTTSTGWDGSAFGTTVLSYLNSKLYYGLEGAGTGVPGVALGYTLTDTGSNYTDVKHGMVVLTNRVIKPMKDSLLQAAITETFNDGDLLTVAIDGTNLTLGINGVDVYTSAATITSGLKAKTSLYTIGDEVVEVLNTNT